jgi:hypothetical protein
LINVFKLNKNYDIMEKMKGILNKEKRKVLAFLIKSQKQLSLKLLLFEKKRIQVLLNPLLYFLKTIDYSVQSFGEDFL